MKLYERSEDPVYVMDNEVPIDLEYYVENQLQGPIDRIFEVVFPNYSSKDLFQGKHTLNITNNQQVSKQKGLGAFASKVYKCMMCNEQIKGEGTSKGQEHKEAVCKECKRKFPDKQAELFIKATWDLRSLQEEYKHLWTECQRCQGTKFEEIICSNNDCPIFYRRKKVIKDIDNANDNLGRFEFDGTAFNQNVRTKQTIVDENDSGLL